MPRDQGHPPAFPLYAADFSSDGVVEAMTTEQVGAYMLLLCKAWYENPPGSIPNNDSVLARWARLAPDRWSECRDGVLAAFALGNDGRWHQKRMRNEYSKLIAHRRDKQKAGKQGAEKRWGKNERQRHSTANGSAIALPLANDASSFSSSSSISEGISFYSSALARYKPPGDYHCREVMEALSKWEQHYNRMNPGCFFNDIIADAMVADAKRNGWTPERFAAGLIKAISVSSQKNIVDPEQPPPRMASGGGFRNSKAKDYTP